MAFTTGGSSFAHPVGLHTEVPTFEIIPLSKSYSLTQQPETDTMEVHHHTHGNDSHQGKNWKSYFREFLMLFLAVFCGFLAEYQLEHKIENDREKVYIKSMIEDLQTDTFNLRKSTESFLKQETHFDTVLQLFPALATGYNHQLRSNLDAIIGYKDFFPADKTLQQLKNSGGMRLIRNKKVADGITLYDSRLKEYEKSLATLDAVFTKMYDLGLEIQDVQQLEADKQIMSIQQIENNNKNYLLVSDNGTLGIYYNRIKSYRYLRQIVLRRMNGLRTNANELMAVLKTEYKLK